MTAIEALQAFLDDFYATMPPIGELNGHPVWLGATVIAGLGYAPAIINKIASGALWGPPGQLHWILEGEALARFAERYSVPNRRRVVLLFEDGVRELLAMQEETGREYRRLFADAISEALSPREVFEALEELAEGGKLPGNVRAIKSS